MDFIAITPDVFEILTTAPHTDQDIPHYDNKALALFMLLAYRSGADLKIHTSHAALCSMLGITARAENLKAVKNNLLQMQEDGIIKIQKDIQIYFWIILNKEAFIPKDNYAIIYFEEFEHIFTEKNRDILFILLYQIKKHKHQNTNISFISERTIAAKSYLNLATVEQGIKKLRKNVLDTYKMQVKFNEGYPKTICLYRSVCDGTITQDEAETLTKQLFTNIKSITRKDVAK